MNTRTKIFFFLFLIFLTPLIAGCSILGNTSKKVEIEGVEKGITLYKDSSCGCCDIYSQYIKKQGFQVESTNTNVQTIKEKYGVPLSMQSCHTSVISGYFVEGHVPAEAIDKLLTEKPDIKGIALPGMPSGSPGMSGSKYGDFVIYAINKDGSTSEFMRI